MLLPIFRFKEEMTGNGTTDWSPEFGVVQGAGRLDTIGI
jgi:hypothetical protein